MTDDEPIDLLLVIALQYPCEDYYFTESAVVLLDALAELDDESAAVTITLAALEAEAESCRN